MPGNNDKGMIVGHCRLDGWIMNLRAGADYILPRRVILSSTSQSLTMVICPCGADSITRTSWTTSNPGRRFYCCSRTVRCCSFICWMDQPLDSRSIDIVRGLLRSKKNIEEAYAVVVQESRISKIILAFSWIFFV
ncbi:hypothetical protein OSB04_002678, partial [Centaurea solstitialis]